MGCSVLGAAHLPVMVDLRAQLADRLSRLQAMIKFVNTSGMLNKLSRTSKRALMRDAEFLSAFNALWLQQNLKMNVLSQSQRPNLTFLRQVIEAYMSSIQREDENDMIRSFFRTQVCDFYLGPASSCLIFFFLTLRLPVLSTSSSIRKLNSRRR